MFQVFRPHLEPLRPREGDGEGHGPDERAWLPEGDRQEARDLGRARRRLHSYRHPEPDWPVIGYSDFNKLFDFLQKISAGSSWCCENTKIVNTLFEFCFFLCPCLSLTRLKFKIPFSDFVSFFLVKKLLEMFPCVFCYAPIHQRVLHMGLCTYKWFELIIEKAKI